MGTFANFSAYVALEANSLSDLRGQKEGNSRNRESGAAKEWKKERKEKNSQQVEYSQESAKDRQRQTERASFRLIRPAIQKMLKSERMHIVATKLHHPRLALPSSLYLPLSLFVQCCAHKGINQSRYHLATMTIVRISKRKNTVISLFSVPSSSGPRFISEGTFNNIIAVSLVRGGGTGRIRTQED